MKTLTLLLLLGLALPYARPPLCAVLGPEHETAAVHRVADRQETSTSDAGDCHTPMACDVTVQAALLAVEPPAQFIPPSGAPRKVRALRPPTPIRCPVSPPPKAI